MKFNRAILFLGTVAAFVMIGAGALLGLNRIEAGTRGDLRQSLETVLETSHQSLRSWFRDKESTVKVWTANERLVLLTQELLLEANTPQELADAPAQKKLRTLLSPVFKSWGYRGFFIIDPDNINIASSRDFNLGFTNLLIAQEGFLERTWNGDTLISQPLRSNIELRDYTGELVEGLATMFSVSAIRNANDEVIALLAFRLDPDESYSQLLQRGRFGNSGETYAFNAQGKLLSESRFNQQLWKLGLIDSPAHSSLHVDIRDPGVDLTVGMKPTHERKQQPLTVMAAAAIDGHTGGNLDGYNDYRGVRVVGAWTWDNFYNFGMTTELDYAEAYAPLRQTQFVVVLFALFAASLIVVLVLLFIRGQRKLEASEENLGMILNSAAEGIYGLDLEGRTTFINPAVCKMLGYSEAELIGQPAHNLIHHSYPDGTPYPKESCYMYAAFHEGKEHHISDEVLWRKDGSSFPIEYTSTPIRHGDEITGAVVTFRDITDRLAAEKELEESRELLTVAIENISDGFVLYDAEDRLVMCNTKYKNLYPTTRDQIIVGATYEKILRGGIAREEYLEAIGREDEFIAERMEARKAPRELFELKITGDRWIRYAERAIPGGGRVGVRVDITELKEAMEAADSANKAKTEFLSSMSHELRTPLNAILGFGQMLEFNPKEPLTEAQQGCVDHILKGGKHLLDLINEVLDLSKIEAGHLDVSLEEIDSGHIVEECLSLVTTLADKRGISIETLRNLEDWPHIRADYTRFKQILLNLMSNAVKYNNENGSIRIDAKETAEGRVRISIADTGPGIDAQQQKALFKPFSRLGAENSEIEGTGIGLTITKQLVEMMSGDIGLHSVVGEGSTFWIELPLVGSGVGTGTGTEAGAGQKKASDSMAQMATHEQPDIRGRVLYVEDNPANLQLMEMIMDRIEGIEMISSHSAELGIEMARSQRPDIILMDINLPGMNGFEALNKLKEFPETADIPVIAISARATKSDIDKGVQAGFFEYLTKPVQVTAVTTTIERALKQA